MVTRKQRHLEKATPSGLLLPLKPLALHQPFSSFHSPSSKSRLKKDSTKLPYSHSDFTVKKGTKQIKEKNGLLNQNLNGSHYNSHIRAKIRTYTNKHS